MTCCLPPPPLLPQDKTAIVWSVKASSLRLSPLHSLSLHEDEVAHLSWSPDDSQLLTCSDRTLRLWDTGTGQLLHSFRRVRPRGGWGGAGRGGQHVAVWAATAKCSKWLCGLPW